MWLILPFTILYRSQLCKIVCSTSLPPPFPPSLNSKYSKNVTAFEKANYGDAHHLRTFGFSIYCIVSEFVMHIRKKKKNCEPSKQAKPSNNKNGAKEKLAHHFEGKFIFVKMPELNKSYQTI